jgi:hypothetical protein
MSERERWIWKTGASPLPLLGALILALCVRSISSGDPLQHRARPRPQQRARLGVAPILRGFVPLLTTAIGRRPCRTPAG